MLLAAMPGTPIRRLVLNDVGPFIPKAAIERIRRYLGGDPRFRDLAALEAMLRQNLAPMGGLDDAQWRHLAETSSRVCDDGSIGLAYAPSIALAFAPEPVTDVILWRWWDANAFPPLVLRGGT